MSGEDPNSAGLPPEPAEAAAQAPQAPVEQPLVAEPAPAVAEPVVPPAPDPAPEPTPTVGSADASYGAPAGSAVLGGSAAVDPHPEKLVGAAFAGGLVGALFLKALAKRRHR